MSSRLLLGVAALSGSLLVSCTVYPEHGGPGKKGQQPQQTVLSPEQQELQKKRDELKKKEEELKKKEEEANKTAENLSKPEGGTTEPTQPKPKQENKKDYPFANPVPGKEGFVFSPYNNKMVDVRDIPSGTLVQDPTYQSGEKKYFRVP
ncbi:hypothetical protein [Luteolibacter sp. LG18]|uniref:hypothetical protein n=1 Tax=Luteolibacter sp. LG18 TaxID=2819286 RepID=UPI002B2FEA78|nr:hypothetical protein llg_37790 [Luteolibacter sp. LG18]